MEKIFNINPVRTMSPIFNFPELKTMAFGGVATGNIKAQEAANVAPANNGNVSIFKEILKEKSKGNVMLAVAVFDVISVKKLMDAIMMSIRIATGKKFNPIK